MPLQPLSVDPASTLQLADALIAAGRQDLSLLVLPRRGHYLEDDAYFKQRRARFVVETLGGPAPMDSRSAHQYR